MVILHIASITNNLYSGVCNVVPKHVFYQGKDNDVALLNVNGTIINGCERQLDFHSRNISDLNAPFSNPDLIIFHELYYPIYLIYAFQAKMLDIPYIIVPHGCLTSNAQKQKWLKKKIGNYLFFNRFIHNSAAIQYLSESERKRTTFSWNSFIGTNGVDLPSYEKHYNDNYSINISYVGRLDIENKGIDIMIDAIELIKQTLIDNKCVINIYGPNDNGIYDYINERIDSSHLSQCLVLHGPVLNEEKADVLKNADIFIQSSRSEGMPMGILEALSYGLPCIVTEGTTLGDLLEDNKAGWMAKSDSQDLAKAIICALRDKPYWQIMSNNAANIVANRFQWQVVCDQTLHEYSNIVKQIG